MTKDDFIRGCVLVLCVLILAACIAGIIRTANHHRADAMLREYYGDTLRFAGGSFYYVKEGKKPNYYNGAYRADQNTTYLLKNAINLLESSGLEMSIPAAVSADTESITVTLTSTQDYAFFCGKILIEWECSGSWYTLNRKTSSHVSSLILKANSTVELPFSLDGEYPPGRYRLATNIFGNGIAPRDNFFIAAEFVIE